MSATEPGKGKWAVRGRLRALDDSRPANVPSPWRWVVVAPDGKEFPGFYYSGYMGSDGVFVYPFSYQQSAATGLRLFLDEQKEKVSNGES